MCIRDRGKRASEKYSGMQQVFGNIGRREQSGLFGGRILSVKNLIITIAIVILMSMLNAFQLRCFEIMR